MERIANIISNVDDADEASDVLKSIPFKSGALFEIEEEIGDILPDHLSNINDLDELLRLREKFASSAELKQQVEDQIYSTVSSVDSDGMPEWFEDMLIGRKKIPEFMITRIVFKVQEIYNSVRIE